MTVLSIQRVINIRKLVNNYKKPDGVDKWDVMNVTLLTSILIIIALLFALVPLIEALEDWFVNGVYYVDENKLFIGAPGKSKHIAILRSTTGNSKHYPEILIGVS